jgi:hypothetical protein
MTVNSGSGRSQSGKWFVVVVVASDALEQFLEPETDHRRPSAGKSLAESVMCCDVFLVQWPELSSFNRRYNLIYLE